MATITPENQKNEVSAEQRGNVDWKRLSEMIISWNITEMFEKGKADHYYTLTVRNILVALLGCGCIGIIFYLPALFTAKSAQELDAAGKKQEAEAAAQRARNLNIIGLITGTISAVVFIIIIFAIIIAVYV